MGIPRPRELEVGSGSHASQTAEILKALSPSLIERKPDLVLVVGDVNSTIAVSLAAVSLAFVSAPRRAGSAVLTVPCPKRSTASHRRHS